MLYHLLFPLSEYVGFFNLFQYISFRGGGALLTALAISLYFGKPIIKKLRNLQGKGQPIRSDGPESHLAKAGTPTMGGIIILLSMTVSALLWADLSSAYTLMILIATLGFGAIGFADDYLKVALKNPKGVPGKIRLAAGAAISLGIACWVYYLAPETLQGILTFPLSKSFTLDLGLFFIAFAPFVIVGTANAVNLTDGLDGLATGPVLLPLALLQLLPIWLEILIFLIIYICIMCRVLVKLPLFLPLSWGLVLDFYGLMRPLP